MLLVGYIFETTSNREMISRFCSSGRKWYDAHNTISKHFLSAVIHLEEAALPTTHISKKHILEALRDFVICEQHRNIYGKVFSKIGKVVCFYLLANRQAMQSEVESITLTPVPRKVNMTGVMSHVGRAAAVVGGLTLLPFYFIGGAALAVAGSKIPVEDAVINDPEIQELIDRIQSVDFNPLYDKIS